MAEEFWKSSPFGEDSIFHPSWEEKQRLAFLDREQNISKSSVPSVTLECPQNNILPIKTKVTLRLKVEGVSVMDLGGGYDVVISCSNKAVTLSMNKFNAEKGWILLTNVESTSSGEVTLDVKVDNVKKNSIKLTFLNSKDVFQQDSVDALYDELKYIKPFADGEIPPEYDENYCMQAAERGLSALLKNTTNFYSVERITHAHKNKIGFSGKTVYDRGNAFQKNGFVEKIHTFNKYKINQTKRELINKSKDNNEARNNYKKVNYDIIELSESDKKNLFTLLEADIKNKEIGYHIYYFTVTNGFHTLLLIINNKDTCNPTYEMWDQHGLTSSSGKLKDIGEGFRRQTSWTFANTCLNRYFSGTTKYFDSTETKLWKIKRK
jgi:Fe2+ or Zn2+ uptake regulation protein